MSEFKNKSFTMFAKVKSFNAEEGIIEGYASTFGNKDRVGDIVRKGAFADTDKTNIKLLFQHNYNYPIGKITNIDEDNDGLKFTAYIDEEAKTPNGISIRKVINDFNYNTFSIGYRVKEGFYSEEEKAYILQKVELFEVSLVGTPANPKAKLTSYKSLEQAEKMGDIADYLKEEYQMSNSEIKALRNAIIKAAKLEIEQEISSPSTEGEIKSSTETDNGKSQDELTKAIQECAKQLEEQVLLSQINQFIKK